MIPPLIQIPAKKCTCECLEPQQPLTPEIAIGLTVFFLLPLIVLVVLLIRDGIQNRKDEKEWEEKKSKWKLR